MAIENAVKYTEKFSKEFQQLLTPDNSFYLNTKGITSNALSVNIPQYLTEVTGPADPTSNGALSVVEWTEDNKVVTQKRFRTNVMQVPDYEEFFTSQEQKMDALESMKDFVDTNIGNFAAYKFATDSSANTVYTSGTATRPTEVVGSNATVKVATKADMLAVKKLIGKSNIKGGEWFCLASPEFISDLLAIDEFVDSNKLGEAQSRLINGEFVKILGIKFYERAPQLGANVGYTSGGTKQDIYGVVGSADTVTDNTIGGAIFWNSKALYANKGMSKTYIDSNDAIYQSALMSMNFTYGVEPARLDGAGLIALLETQTA